MSENGFQVSEKLLQRCHERAAGYDRENKFAQEDFDELKEEGYLLMTVPKEMGGHGMSLQQVGHQTRRLAYHAPATALMCNMHHYWVGLAADLYRGGDRSCEWILAEAAKGKVFAAGHAETGNDLPLFLSTTKAERVDGGWKFTGRKAFGSLTPVWDYLGVHGMDTSDPEKPKVVHSFLPRGADGITIKETWDVLSMRPTRSDDTILEGAFGSDEHTPRLVAAGAAGVDAFVLGIFAWALVGFANVYYGLARRVRDVVFEAVKGKGSIALTRPMAYHPEIQHGAAEIVLAINTMEPQIEALARDWSETTEHGPEFAPRIVATKHNVVTACWKVADLAMDLSGGFGMFKKSELERLFRDARAGRFHPANPLLTHEFLAKTALGIDLDEQPRWG